MEEEALICSTKIAFDSKRQAQTAATVAQYQHGTVLSVYLCRDCQLWHLSSGG